MMFLQSSDDVSAKTSDVHIVIIYLYKESHQKRNI